MKIEIAFLATFHSVFHSGAGDEIVIPLNADIDIFIPNLHSSICENNFHAWSDADIWPNPASRFTILWV
jgi:hypothetical protein